MFCTHNELDLQPVVVLSKETDWVGIRCTACKQLIGDKVKLVDLVGKAVQDRWDAENPPEGDEEEDEDEIIDIDDDEEDEEDQ